MDDAEATTARSVEEERTAGRRETRSLTLLDMVWPETGLQTMSRLPRKARDHLGDDDLIELQIDFVTLALTPLEFIQLASFLRMSIDGLLDHHPSLQRAVVNAFDIRS